MTRIQGNHMLSFWGQQLWGVGIVGLPDVIALPWRISSAHCVGVEQFVVRTPTASHSPYGTTSPS